MQALRKVDDWMHRLGNPDASVSEFELHLLLRDLEQGLLLASPGESFILRGLALGRLEKHEDALSAFNQAILHGGDRWDVHRNRGWRCSTWRIQKEQQTRCCRPLNAKGGTTLQS